MKRRVKAGLWLVIACLACCIVGLAVSSGVVFGQGTSPGGQPSGGGAGVSSLFTSSLAVAGSPTEVEQLQAQEEAKRRAPGAVAERQASRTRFENLNNEQAMRLAGEMFPAVIDDPDGGPPVLPAGEHVTKYLTDHAAQVDLGDGNHAVLESLAPMALETSSGRVPVDLGLTEAGEAFEPATPLVDVRIPKRLSEGVRAVDRGVSVTPVTANGVPLTGSRGTRAGASVFFGGTQTDTDTIVKPSSSGFAVDTILRSVNSPQRLFFRVGLPQGARLAHAASGSDTVRVIKEGVTIATVPAPTARDATGTPVPVSISVSGSTLALTVDHGSGEVQYPVEVDPEFTVLSESTLSEAAWPFVPHGSGFYHGANGTGGPMWLGANGGGSVGQWGELYYKTNGDSRIYQVNTVTSLEPTEVTEAAYFIGEASIYLELEGSGGYENSTVIAHDGGVVEPNHQVCPAAGCVPGNGAEHNLVRLVDLLTANGVVDQVRVSTATVAIAQPKETHATVSYNTSSPELGGTPNVMYTGGWFGPNTGAFEFQMKDVGLGVAERKFEYYESTGWKISGELEQGLKKYRGGPSCVGVQCAPAQSEVLDYANMLHLMNTQNGEVPIRVSADDAMEHTWSSEHGESGEAILKIDKTAPHGIKLSGIPSKGEEYELGEIEAHLKVEATDGESSTVASSGVKSIKLGLDGRELGKPQGSCVVAKGECTASGEWSLNGAELGVGTYVLTVVATDNANNVETKHFTLNVYHATPVAMGPGSVNPESGDFALGVSDVNMSGGAGSLALTRHYDSRNLEEGVEGPLGPQWSISLGSLASLEVLPDKSVLVVGPEGLTHFSVKETGGFEAPKGDQNLTLELKGSEYLLKDAAKGTTTKFTLPSGAQSWMPTVSEGPVVTNTLTDTYQSVEAVTEYPIPSTFAKGIVSGPHGSLWFSGAGSVNQIPVWGTSATEYQLPSHEEISSESLAMGPDGNVWFTTIGNIDVIGKITPSGKVTEYPLPGEKHAVGGITVGPEGNMWFTMTGREGSGNYIGKITTAGVISEYPLPAEGQANEITAGPNGEQALWFTDAFHGRIGKITTAGTVTEYQLSGAAPWGIVAGPDGNVWYTDYTSNRIGKITTSGGGITEYALPESSAPHGITSGPDGNLWFTDTGTNKIGKITTSGAISEFALPTGSSPHGIVTGPDGKLWFADTGSNKIGTITTSGRIIEPLLELAPHPSATCTPGKLEKGCRALEFTYASATTATGEGKSEWGEYKGRLMKASFIAYNPSTKVMETKPVAEYSYDKLGRLRAEWDPRLASPLKTFYGYDAEGHITALTPPGQESTAFSYGSISGDASSGRLLKLTQAPASTKLWGGQLPVNTEAPKLSGTPVVGVRMTVSNGVFSNEPTAYGYQWEDCNGSGEECTPILGATGANYTVASSDVGHVLKARVSATNGGGTVAAVSAASLEVVLTAGELTEYKLPAGSGPQSIVTGPDKNLWFVEHATNKIGKITTAGTVSEYTLPAGSAPTGIAAGPDGNLWFTDFGTSKIGKITTAGTISEYALPAGSKPWNIASGPDGELWYTDSGTNKIGKINTTGTVVAEYALPAGSEPTGIVTGPDKNLWFTDNGSNKIGKSTTAGTITEYPLPAGSGPAAIASGPDGNLWFTNYKSDAIGKITTAGTITEYALPAGDYPWGITAEPHGNIAFAEYSASKIGTSTTSGTITQYSLPVSSDPDGITVGPDENLWVAETVSSHIGKINLHSEGELRAPVPGSTIEYNVPVSGAGAPYAMGTKEVETWGQQAKEEPVYATAIFAPDEPQTWPASSYKRATISYMDSQARTVNVASPSGAISTLEYNGENAVTRSLSADDRAAALKEANPAAASELLDTKSTYNSAGQLTSTLGPQHMVKLVKGKEGKPEETLARNHVTYHYDEGAKEVEEKTHETYDLVTKTEDGAENLSKEEFDKRTAVTSYSGQSNVGWKLRRPTSVTTDPGGLNLTSTTKYEENTGNVTETKTPAGAGGDASVPPAYALAFGSKGTGAGQFEGPQHDALDSSGNVWVADYGNHRVEEFSSAGVFKLAVGWGVKDGKAEAETCTASCKPGIAGSGNAQFEGPFGIAVNQTSGNVYVSDSTGSRIEEISSAGAFVASFGAKGSGAGQLSSPQGVTIDSSANVWVADAANSRVEEFSSAGVFKLAVGWGVKDGKAEAETCSTTCQAGITGSGNGQLATPSALAFSGGNAYVIDYTNDRVEEYSSAGAYLSQFGSKGSATGQFEAPYDIASEATTGDLYVADSANNRVQKLTAAGAYLATFGAKGSENGQFLVPTGVTVNASGSVYVSDHNNNRVQEWVPAITGNPGAHESKTIYYTASTEAEVEACRNHPEWVGLPCETTPVLQPGTSGLPALPVSTIEYNMWDEPEKTEEKFGSGAEAKIRIKKTTYDAAGRPLTSEETSSIDTALPVTTNKYSTETGAMVERSTTVGETTKTIKSAYNTLGQITEYTDAAGNKATFEYEKEKDARLLKVSDEKGNQTYHYDETTGVLAELVDSAAGTFKATYDVAGKLTSESYPNAMTAKYTHNQVGDTTGIEYVKTAHCAKTCPEVWFSDANVPSIHGETLKQSSTLSEEPSYTYDAAGRLTQVQEIPTGGEGCTTRIYAYDEEGNRTSLTTRKPGTEGKCASEGGSTEWHTYDTANRMTDTGVVYEPFGNTTKLPPADADGSELVSEYYVDSQVAKQEQNKETIEYKLDPEDRTLETISKGNTSANVVTHYDGPGDALAWTSEEIGKTWTRNIPGIGGALTGIQTSSGSKTLLLHDLQGDVVGEAADNETETKLLKEYNSTEFGVPGKEAPPTYAWLGAAGVAGELPSGVITQDGVTYVPQVGRPLQTEGVVLAAFSNNPTPFSRPVEAWVGSKAGEGAARELAKAEQERQEREAANKPPGALPATCQEFGTCAEEAECDEEIEGCGIDPQHGENLSGCSVWASWSVNGLDGHFKCSGEPQNFELQVEIQEVLSGGLYGGRYRMFEAGKHGWHRPSPGEHTWLLEATPCKLGKSYRGWVWGRTYFDGQTYWSASEIDHRLDQCVEGGGMGAGVEDIYFEPY
jgi:streptogramin lyase